MTDRKQQADENRSAASKPVADMVKRFHEAVYEVHWIGGETLRLTLNERARVLEAAFNLTGCLTSTFISAANPRGELLSWQENSMRHQNLREEMDRRGLRGVWGRVRDPSGIWPAEDGFLILGCSRETAVKLGRQFGQGAILWSEKDFIPRLLVLR